MDLEPFLTVAVRNAIVAHMRDCAPQEACGAIIVRGQRYRYARCKNVAVDLIKEFKFGPAVNAHIQTDETVVAYVHTHPVGPTNPSKKDMEIQKLVGKPSVICAVDPQSGVVDIFSFGDHLLDLPLDGKVFRYGVTDCYEAIRSWVWQNEKRKMTAFPRRNGFWNLDESMDYDPEDLDMYSRYYQDEGFQPYEPNFSDASSPRHPKVGDLVLMKMGPTRDNVINHAGIYVGGNLVYHHRIGKLSGDTPIGYLPPGMVRKWARYGGVQ